MLKHLLVSLSLVLPIAGVAVASPLHDSDPNYRGAFTLLAVANTSGASARYSTQINMTNVSDHTVHIRLEFYSTAGYREGTMVNTLQPATGAGAGSFWGGSRPNWEFTNVLGTDGMGAVRVVAVRDDGSEDPTAVIHGYGRLWIEPYTGGRISEYIPALSDYEAAGSYRRSRFRPGSFDGGVESVPFVVDPRPFARDLHDATYGGSRVNVAFVNFDREREVTFTIGGRDGKDSWGGTYHSDPVEVRVPAGSVRQVPLQLVSFTGSNVPPIFPYDTPLVSQVFGVGSSNVGGDWATYATLIDGTSGGSTFFFDAMTDSR